MTLVCICAGQKARMQAVLATGGARASLATAAAEKCNTTYPTTIPTVTNTYTATNETTDALGWTHYWNNNGTVTNFADDKLLVSVKKNGNNIGCVGDGTFSATLYANPTPVQITAPYVGNTTGWWTMKRYWNITPTTQPTSNVSVRFYYTTADYTALNTAVGGILAAHDDMHFWKINDFNPAPSTGHTGIPYAPAYNGTGFWQYAAGSASTTAYTYSTFGTNQHYAEYVIGKFSGGGGGAGGAGGEGALPVELSYFKATADRNNIAVNWTTASERNNKGFELQRSMNGKDGFQTIAWVNGNGNSAEKHNYNFVDSKVRKGLTYYYRLNQIDFDGSSHLSHITSARLDGKQIGVALIPNPAHNKVTIFISGENTQEKTIAIYNIQGQLMSEKTIGKETNVEMDINHLDKGIYMVKVSTDAEYLVEKLIVE